VPWNLKVHYHNNSLHPDCILIPCSRVLLEKPIVTQLVKKFPALYGTWRFITMFTRAHHWSLSWARCIQSTPSLPISLTSVPILHTHLCLCHVSGLFPSGIANQLNPVYTAVRIISISISVSISCRFPETLSSISQYNRLKYVTRMVLHF